jgi:hypothetical protein
MRRNCPPNNAGEFVTEFHDVVSSEKLDSNWKSIALLGQEISAAPFVCAMALGTNPASLPEKISI